MCTNTSEIRWYIADLRGMSCIYQGTVGANDSAQLLLYVEPFFIPLLSRPL